MHRELDQLVVDPGQAGQPARIDPKARQIRAFAVAMVKSSVPRGDQSSSRMFDVAMTTDRIIHSVPSPLASTIDTESRRHAQRQSSVR